MKVYEIYFSPTGNTQKVVEWIADTWEEHNDKIDISRLDYEYDKIMFNEDELCIIGVPSFGGRVPTVALDRLCQMKANNTPTILVTTYGNRDYDDTLLELKKELCNKGFKIVAAIASVAEHTIMHQFAKGRPNENDEKEIKEFGRKIKLKIETDEINKDIEVKGNYPYKDYKGLPIKPETSKKCTKCGVCAKSCPTGAISIIAPNETDKNICITCMRCISICPQQARKLNSFLVFAASKKMQKECSVDKKNELYI